MSYVRISAKFAKRAEDARNEYTSPVNSLRFLRSIFFILYALKTSQLFIANASRNGNGRPRLD